MNNKKKIVAGIVVLLFGISLLLCFIMNKNTTQNVQITKGQWVQILFEKLEMAVNETNAMRVWPEEIMSVDEVLQNNDPANREFVAYTVYHAMGFCSDNIPECTDTQEIQFPKETALMIEQEFLELIDGKFCPQKKITSSEQDMILSRIDYFIEYKNITEKDEVCNIEFLQEVVELNLEEGYECTRYDYVEKPDIYVLKLEKNVDISEVKEDQLLLVEGPGSNDLFYVTSIQEGSKKNSIECIRPNMDEVIGTYEIVEKARIVPALITDIPEDVTCELKSIKEERGGIRRAYDLEEEYESIGSISYTFKEFKVSKNVTLNGEVSIDLPELILVLRGKGSDVEEISVSLAHTEGFEAAIKLNVKDDADSGEEKTKTDENTVQSNKHLLATIYTPICAGVNSKLTLYADVGLSGEISFSWELDSVTDIQYKNGVFRMSSEGTEKVDTVQINAASKVGAIPNIALNMLGGFDVIGVDMPIGIIASAGRSVHADYEPDLICDDMAAYLYLNLKLDKTSFVGMIFDEAGVGIEKKIWKQSNSPLKIETHTENGKKVEKCTYAGILESEYGLSEQSYDEALQVSEKYYVVKKNGYYGVVDFEGNEIIPCQYSAYKIVAENEIEFDDEDTWSDPMRYVYSLDSGEKILEYKSYESFDCTVGDYVSKYDFEVLTSNEQYGYENLEYGEIEYFEGPVPQLNRYDDYTGEYLEDYEEYDNHLYREYCNGIFKERIWTTWTFDAGDDFYYRECICYRDANTNELIYSGYGDFLHNGEETGLYWIGDFSTDIAEDTAIMLEELKNGKDSLVLISDSRYEKKDFSYEAFYCCTYDNDWIKNYEEEELFNVNTQETIVMPVDFETPEWMSAHKFKMPANGATYTIEVNGKYIVCNRDKVIKRACQSVDFVNDDYIVIKNLQNQYVYIDYSGEEELTVLDYGDFVGGKALVYDGSGIYMMNETLEKVGDYIYKGYVDGCDTGVVILEGEYYLIGKN